MIARHRLKLPILAEMEALPGAGTWKRSVEGCPRCLQMTSKCLGVRGGAVRECESPRALWRCGSVSCCHSPLQQDKPLGCSALNWRHVCHVEASLSSLLVSPGRESLSGFFACAASCVTLNAPISSWAPGWLTALRPLPLQTDQACERPVFGPQGKPADAVPHPHLPSVV